MKVIFSRKGFDSKYGGNCSPIMPDKSLISLPIPVGQRDLGIRYDEIYIDLDRKHTYKKLMDDLHISVDDNLCHFDPDLRSSSLERKPIWEPLFGQSNASRTHLIDTAKVRKDDLFLFYGTFRRTFYKQNGNLDFESDHPRHIIFGYLLSDHPCDLGRIGINRFKHENPDKERAFDHPHFSEAYGRKRNNVVFASQKGFSSRKFGAGVFKYNKNLLLTKDGFQKSVWELPDLFDPNYMTISYHSDEDRFRILGNDRILLQTVAVGQEFVVSAKDKTTESKLEQWAIDLIENSEVFE